MWCKSGNSKEVKKKHLPYLAFRERYDIVAELGVLTYSPSSHVQLVSLLVFTDRVLKAFSRLVMRAGPNLVIQCKEFFSTVSRDIADPGVVSTYLVCASFGIFGPFRDHVLTALFRFLSPCLLSHQCRLAFAVFDDRQVSLQKYVDSVGDSEDVPSSIALEYEQDDWKVECCR